MSSVVPRCLETIAFDPELTADKMVWIAGPRQSGKTTLARQWLGAAGSGSLYYNWDDLGVRSLVRSDPHFFEAPARALRLPHAWIAFDEIHKASRWRDLLKGWFDVFHRDFRFVVTGSARLDLLRRGGDSLVGRYLLFHLFPLSFREYLELPVRPESPTWFAGSHSTPEWDIPADAGSRWATFSARGPFPEPLLRDSVRFSRRWSEDYLATILRGDIRDLTRLGQLDRIETLVSLLPRSVGSPVSYSSLGRDLEVAHTTVRSWLEVLRRFYLAFPVKPWTRRVRRALRRESKWYLLDWSRVPDESARLENVVAAGLMQSCQLWSEAGYGRFELRYVRTRDGREIDFVVVRDELPVALVEVKQSDLQPARSLVRREVDFGPGVPAFQVVATPHIARRADSGVWVVSVDRFLAQLP